MVAALEWALFVLLSCHSLSCSCSYFAVLVCVASLTNFLAGLEEEEPISKSSFFASVDSIEHSLIS